MWLECLIYGWGDEVVTISLRTVAKARWQVQQLLDLY